MERDDVIIVASVSCIYGLGSPGDYKNMCVSLERGAVKPRKDILRELVATHYERNEVEFTPGRFRVRGESIEIFPAYLETAIRVELFGDEIEKIREIHPLTGAVISEKDRVFIYPARHFVTTQPTIERALGSIRAELKGQLDLFNQKGKLLEAQRLEQRTRYDLETSAGRAPSLPHRLFPQGFSDHCGRVPCHPSPNSRDVRGRPFPEENAG